MTCQPGALIFRRPTPGPTADVFLIRESSRTSDELRLVVQLRLPSVNVHLRPFAVAAIVTQLVTQTVM